MKIKCPICNHTNTASPEGLLGRIYVCNDCHQLLHMKTLHQNILQWLPLAEIPTSSPKGGGNEVS